MEQKNFFFPYKSEILRDEEALPVGKATSVTNSPKKKKKKKPSRHLSHSAYDIHKTVKVLDTNTK